MTITARSGVAVRVAERRARVAELRAAGQTLESIAVTVGASKRTVQRDIDQLLDGLREDQADRIEQWRNDAVVEIDAIGERVWIELDGSPPPAAVASLATTLIRANERVSALLGADAPRRHVVGTEQAPGSIVDIYSMLPVRAIERARDELVRQFAEAIDQRRAYDLAQTERVTAMVAEEPDEPSADPVESIEPTTPVPAPRDDHDDVPVYRPTTRAQERQLARTLEANAETEAAIRGFKRANRVTGPDA